MQKVKKCLIVGAGPVGLTCAHLLSKIGVSTTLFERMKYPRVHPSAHVIHDRSMEIFREIGIHDHILNHQAPSEEWKDFIYCNTASGKIYRKHDHFIGSDYLLSQSLTDCSMSNFPQDKLVNVLYETLPASASVVFDTEISEVIDNGDSVTLKSSQGQTFEGEYVIACDGASSKIRQILGIAMSPSPVLEYIFNINCTSEKLAEILAKRPAMLYFITNPSVSGVIVMHSVKSAEFIIHIPYFPPLETPADFGHEDFKRIINQMVGSDVYLDDIQIKSVIPWKMTLEQAQGWRKNRVILAGDAAHKVTPLGGFGLNLGIQDAHNLYWKLLHPELLDSYVDERSHRLKEAFATILRNTQTFLNIFKAANLSFDDFRKLKSFAESVPFFGKSVFNAGKKLAPLMFDEEKLVKHLINDEHLVPSLFPKDNYMYRYPQGFFDSNTGGGLVPNIKVDYKGTEYPIRHLTGKLIAEHQKPVMLYLKGLNDLNPPKANLEVVTLPSPNEISYMIRPDGFLYSSSVVNPSNNN